MAEAPALARPVPVATGRLQSVDVLRGVTIVAMILVNNPGSWSTVYWPLLHAEWFGCTPTDLIFPIFLFVVGVSIALALGRRVAAGGPRGALVGKIVRRSAILFALGLFLSGYPFGLFGTRTWERLLETWRIPGVLPRIAVCYLVAALLFVFCRRRTLRIWTLVCLFSYWLLMTMVPVPGSGELPDLSTPGQHLAGWLDRVVLGDHLWIYGVVYDPEGLLSTIPALATTLLGVLAGCVLASQLPAIEKVSRLFVRGALLAMAGYVWSWFFPLSKALWTSSYAVFGAGMACMALALCAWFFDVERHPCVARPFVIYGVNAITVFVGSGVLARTLGILEVGEVSMQSWIYAGAFSSWLPPYLASLGYAVAWVVGWYLVLLGMDRMGWRWKV
jgi:predicted acyltransferase